MIRNSSVATPIRGGQSLYNVIRPVNDFWLWWTLVSVLNYILSQVSSILFKGSIIVSGITFIIPLVLVIIVFSRYLSNFNGKRWIIVNIVGILVAVALLLSVALVVFVAYRIIATTDSLPAELIVLVLLPFFAWILALAQWRVLKDYAGEQGRRLWVSANIVSALIIGITSTVVNALTDNQYIRSGSGLITNTLGAVLVGYTLTRILQTYAPPPKIKGSTPKQ